MKTPRSLSALTLINLVLLLLTLAQQLRPALAQDEVLVLRADDAQPSFHLTCYGWLRDLPREGELNIRLEE